MEPKIVVLDVGKKLHNLRTQCSHSAVYLEDHPKEICQRLSQCVMSRFNPYGELLAYIAELKHGKYVRMPEEQLNRLVVAVGDLGVSLIQSMEQSQFYQGEQDLPYAFQRATKNVFVLERQQERPWQNQKSSSSI